MISHRGRCFLNLARPLRPKRSRRPLRVRVRKRVNGDNRAISVVPLLFSRVRCSKLMRCCNGWMSTTKVLLRSSSLNAVRPCRADALRMYVSLRFNTSSCFSFFNGEIAFSPVFLRFRTYVVVTNSSGLWVHSGLIIWNFEDPPPRPLLLIIPVD